MFVRPPVLLASALALAASLSACSDATTADTTTGKRVALTVSVAPVKKTFTTKVGWDVSLTKALVATGAIYFFDGETLFAHAPRRRLTPLQVLWRIPSAEAHPGHYVPGNTKGEMLASTSVDLLAPGASLGSGEGVSGPFRSATFTFGAPPAGPLAGELGGNVIVLEGTASKGAETRTFRAEVKADELLDAKKKPQIEGCPFTAVDVQGDGDVTVVIDADAWLDHVEFELLPKDQVPAKLTDVTQSELTRSVRGGDRYRFTFAPK